MIVATAGHVDHGKTSLIKSITGVDTDRLEEEKRRGLSINLGFAFKQNRDKTITGFIDVPGHKRFINTMIAGVSAIDVALLVVAADDGPMPQTYEHLEILHFLGVREYIGVITKIDRVKLDRVDYVASQMKDIMKTTCPVFPVCNQNSSGISELEEYLSVLSRKRSVRPAGGNFRLSVDRSFSLKGVGLIATGTVMAGAVSKGDRLRLLPEGKIAKVRSIYAQDQQVQSGGAGQRCAINVTGINKCELRKGDWLTSDKTGLMTDRIDVKFETSRSLPFSIKHLSPVKFHLGAARLSAKLCLLDRKQKGNKISGGARVFAQIRFENEVHCYLGDRFILRDYSESTMLGGGVVLDPLASRMSHLDSRHRIYLESLASLTPEEFLRHEVFDQRKTVDLDRFLRIWNITDKELTELLKLPTFTKVTTVIICDGYRYLVANDQCDAVDKLILEFLGGWHDANPRSEGIQLRIFTNTLEATISPTLLVYRLSELAKNGRIKKKTGLVMKSDFVPAEGTQELKNWRLIEAVLLKSDSKISTLSDFRNEIELDNKTLDEILLSSVKAGRIYRFGKQRFALTETMRMFENFINRLAEKKPEFSVVDVKEIIGLGRNITVELMEYFDSINVTARRGNHRILINSSAAETAFRTKQP